LAWLIGLEGYAVGWIWIIPTALLCGLVQTAVARSFCRNRFVGLGLGLLVGVITVGGMYHIDQCARWGVDWERLDRLPGYVTFRMETDGWCGRDPRMPMVRPLPPQQGIEPWIRPRVNWNWHWGAFIAEVVFLVLCPAGMGWARARRPFSELRGEWFARDAVLLTKASAAGLREALGYRTLAAWVATGAEKTLTHESHVVATVWYCPRPDTDKDAESEVYISVGNNRLLLLEPEEAAVLTGVFPSLTDLAVPEAAKYESADAPSDDPSVARLIQIAGLHVGRAKTWSVRWRGKALMWGMVFVPVLIMFAFFGSVYLGHLILEALGIDDIWLIVYLGVVGIVLIRYVKAWFGPGGGVPFARLVRYYWNVLREQATKRSDVLFPPDDSRVIYCEMAPRRAWTDLSGRRDECEGGLLLIDPEAGLLFEGDRYRYIVPIAAILRGDFEEVTQMGTTDGLYALVLQVRLAGGNTHELPLIPIAGTHGENPWERAMAFRETIAQEVNALSTPPATPPAPPPTATV
jgi:hypothetical protein